jgi:hypothetical protein
MSPAQEADDLWSGRIGFVKEGEVSTLRWDNQTKDFIKGEAPSGAVVPLVIDLEARTVSFQLVQHVVRPHTVTTNLQALLNQNDVHKWTVRPLSQAESFDTWRASVSAVSYFHFRLYEPNPNWIGRERYQAVFESLKTNVLTLEGSAEEEGEIDTGSDWFREGMDHVRKKYGKAVVKGTDAATGEHSEWRGEGEEGVVPAVTQIDVGDDEAEVAPKVLRDSLSDLGDIVVVDTHDEEAEDHGESG